MGRGLTLIFASLCIAPRLLASGSLEGWVLRQIRADEQLLIDALTHSGGRSVPLLQESRTYIPFFLEPPADGVLESAEQKLCFDGFVKAHAGSFVPGGYLYRIRFVSASPLYALSAGEWADRKWYSLHLDKDFAIEPEQVWGGRKGAGYLYASVIAGALPRLLLYDFDGNLDSEEPFDVSAPDFDRRLRTTIDTYSKDEKPVLEMISLSEFVQHETTSWRRLETSPRCNLRNQHEREEEIARLKDGRKWTRGAMIEALQAPPQPGSKHGAIAEPEFSKTAPTIAARAAEQAATTEQESTTSTLGAVMAVMFVGAIAPLWVLLKGRK